MLKHLYIQHFALIDTIELELSQGLTVLTGETGAGKSILIDALQLVLGERADTGLIKTGQDRCEVTALFDVANNPAAKSWLAAQAMDEGEECIIRRVLTQDGRSRATINMRPCALQTVRELGALLVHIHGQHQHQQLLKNDYQRSLLDQYAQHRPLYEAVRDLHHEWKTATHELNTLTAADFSVQKNFLAFQIQELSALALQEDELEILTEEHQRLAHAEQWIQENQQVLDILADEEENNVLQGLYKAQTLVKNPATTELLQQARIQTEEAIASLRQTLKTLETPPEPERMQWIEERLAKIHDIARKHRIAPEDLLTLQQSLQAQYQALDNQAERMQSLTDTIAQLNTHYTEQAKKLTHSRAIAAKKLSEQVSAHLQTLGMAGGYVEIQLLPHEADSVHPHGQERVAFFVATNPGQPLAPLHKVVSGGELSRIALAIQVVAAREAVLPTLIFDEVDVGIGGGVAEIVGKQLKQLGGRAQVLCVTHLPQVAAQGHQHLQVQKNSQAEKTTTQIRTLSLDEKIQEIARMLGGIKITDKTLAHAREMLAV